MAFSEGLGLTPTKKDSTWYCQVLLQISRLYFVTHNFSWSHIEFLQRKAWVFAYGRVVLQRKGGRELLLSPEYILAQMDRSFFGFMGCMAEGYAKVGLRPCVTEIDIERFCPEQPDPASWWKNKSPKQKQ